MSTSPPWKNLCGERQNKYRLLDWLGSVRVVTWVAWVTWVARAELTFCFVQLFRHLAYLPLLAELPLNVALNWARAFIALVRPVVEYAHGSCIQLLFAESQFPLGQTNLSWLNLLLGFAFFDGRFTTTFLHFCLFHTTGSSPCFLPGTHCCPDYSCWGFSP
jgi:hypothetical protein